MPKHTLEPCYYERFGIVIGLGAHYKPKTPCNAHIQAQNLQNIAQNVSAHHQTHFGAANGQSGGKKKESSSSSSTFVLACNKDQ